MCWRNCCEENSGFIWIDVGIYPVCPCLQSKSVRNIYTHFFIPIFVVHGFPPIHKKLILDSLIRKNLKSDESNKHLYICIYIKHTLFLTWNLLSTIHKYWKPNYQHPSNVVHVLRWSLNEVSSSLNLWLWRHQSLILLEMVPCRTQCWYCTPDWDQKKYKYLFNYYIFIWTK